MMDDFREQNANEDQFAGDVSGIFINPNEISIEMTTLSEPTPRNRRHRETIVELVSNLKGGRRTVFNFTKELENAETPTESPVSNLE